MKILLLHCDWVEWEPTKKAVKSAEEPVEMNVTRAEDCLVVFTSVEKADEKDPAKIVQEYLKNVKDVAGQVKTKNIVVYPYAHLSSNLSSLDIALMVLKNCETELKKEGFQVWRAPFGWYKKFSFKTKGHPLSELARELSVDGKDSKITVKKEVKESTGKIILDRRNLPPNDHRILGQDLKIFHLSDEIGAGLPLWMPNGETLKHTLVEYMRQVEEKHGYKYVSTPHIAKGSMYHATGHLPYYADSMYPPIDIDGSEYYLKPMNCPHHHMIFKQLVQSYKDLPLKLAEPGMTYRNELSGVTYGLIRARGFLQNDSHIYVRPDQLKEEFLKVLKLFEEVYNVMGIKGYWFRLSLPDFKENPDKYTGDPKEWEHACEEIRKAMKESGHKFVECVGEAAFYGPKIDVQIKNSQGKEESIATSQIDIVVPKRLDLVFVDDKDKKQNVIIIHRAILGSFDRFIAYLLEQTEGRLSLWLAPVQVKVLTFTDRNIKSVEKLAEELKKEGIRAEADLRDHTVEYKVRDAEMQKIPYIVVIGDKEEEKNTLAVRTRGKKDVEFGIRKEDFISKLKKEIEEKMIKSS
ncbi:MAG: threonine--tRNA ligase [Candidatus Aenigmarchaeota archaeon]|nr:threonine--tRNA ligase [Candidatus Aenigmarchaeota archaeon]